MMRIRFTLLFLFMFIQPLCLAHTEQAPLVPAMLDMAYYVDHNHSQSIDSIKEKTFTPFSGTKNFGLGNTKVWLRVTPRNLAPDQTYFLYFWATFTDDLKIYLSHDKVGEAHLLSVQGDKKNRQNWSTKSAIKPLEIHRLPEPAVYYYAIDNDGFTLVDLRIDSIEEYIIFKRNNLIKKAVFFGFGLMLLIWILFSRIRVPLSLVVTFIGFLGSVVMVIAFGSGDVSEIADSVGIDDDTIGKLLLALTFIWTTLFSVFFLQMLGLRSLVLTGIKLFTAAIVGLCLVHIFYSPRFFMAVIFTYFVLSNVSSMLLVAGSQLLQLRDRLLVTGGYFLIVLTSSLNILSFFEKFPIIIINYNFPLISALFFVGLMLSIILWESNRIRDEGRLANQKLRQEIQENATIQRINREQSGLLAMISHEFKNSLAVVNLELSIMASKGAVFKHSPQTIRSLSDIIDNCLLLDQSGQGQLAVNLEPMSCRECLLAVLAQEMPFARIQLECNARHYFYVDERIFAILAKNLLQNALKYGDPHAPIEVRVAMDSSAPAGTPNITVTFANTVGQYGAPEADKVFDKFYRAPAAISLSGSGLGLFIVKQLAQLMLAKVEYAHRGTQVMFTVRLPGFDADEII